MESYNNDNGDPIDAIFVDVAAVVEKLAFYKRGALHGVHVSSHFSR